jgi:hypothetical protein
MVAPRVDDWLLLLLVVDRIYGKFVLFPPMSRGRILEGFYGKQKETVGFWVLLMWLFLPLAQSMRGLWPC